MDYSNRITPENISLLKSNEVFVYGSNLAGKNNLGTAKAASDLFGAKYGQFYGQHGQSFAIPTKDANIRYALPIETIKHYVDKFINEARVNKGKTYYVTAIGTGLSGYKPREIAPLFKDCVKMDNVYLPECFWEVLAERGEGNE
jgi:hypothetical protein